MSRGPWKIKPKVLVTALAEAREAGARLKYYRDGTIEVDFGKPADAAPADDLDRELADWQERHAG